MTVEDDPVNRTDPSGNDSNTVGSAETNLLQGIFPLHIPLFRPPASLELRQIVGVIYAESGTSKYGGENFLEKEAIGETFENQVYYRLQYPRFNGSFGNGTIISSIRNGSVAYGGTQWNQIMAATNDLKTQDELEKVLTLSSERNHFDDSVAAAMYVGTESTPSTDSALNGRAPVGFKAIKYTNPPSSRMELITSLGGTNFFGFKPGREEQ